MDSEDPTMMRGPQGPGVISLMKPSVQQSVFLITIEHRKNCKLHKKYNEWLTKFEEEQKELEKKRMEEQDLKQQ